MNNIIFWASDYSSRSGEGILARIFIKKLKKNKKIDHIYRIKSNFVKFDIKLTKRSKKQIFSLIE